MMNNKWKKEQVRKIESEERGDKEKGKKSEGEGMSVRKWGGWGKVYIYTCEQSLKRKRNENAERERQ